MSVAAKVVHEVTADNSVHSLELSGARGNILDEPMCQSLLEALAAAAATRDGKLLVLAGGGGNFSYGASVQEHFPKGAPRMLDNMRTVIQTLWEFPFPTLAAIEGRCLGGGLELALACGMIFVDEKATLAFPEIKLGSFAPFGTALLEGQVPRAVAEELLLTGREFSPTEALRWGLVNRVVAHGKLEEAIFDFSKKQILPHSASCLRVATRALRSFSSAPAESMRDRMQRMRTAYIEELIPLEDASEGIRAFLEKRYPGWRNR